MGRPSLDGFSGIRVAARNEASVFIIDGVRLDGSAYVTSVSTSGAIGERCRQLRIIRGRVSHWVRDGESPEFSFDTHHAAADWRMAERFSL